MPKQSQISWRQSQQSKLRYAVAKFNAKITRQLKTNPELREYLPSRINIKQVKEIIYTRNDLNNIVKSINRAVKHKDAFLPINSDQGAKTTKWMVHETKLKVNRINRARAKELREANPSTSKGTMGSIKSNNLLPKEFDFKKMTNRDWGKFVESVEKQSMDKYSLNKATAYKENYMKAIENALGGYGDELLKLLEKLPADYIWRKFYDDPVLQINFIYDPLEMMLIAETSLEHWKKAIDDDKIEV